MKVVGRFSSGPGMRKNLTPQNIGLFIRTENVKSYF